MASMENFFIVKYATIQYNAKFGTQIVFQHEFHMGFLKI
jgi:hypothetical protein